MRKKILVAPLNWGLGHATRCIPIIRALLDNAFEPIIASDGVALELLRKEFPELTCVELPSYHIKYSKKGYFFKLKLIKDSPKVIKAINAEKKAIKEIVELHKIDGLISDNRLGAYCKNIPCVFMTHQLQVLSGSTTWLSSKVHQTIISNFDECWVPDVVGPDNLSGKLGTSNGGHLVIKYIGPLSRFKKLDITIRYDIMVLLSGPEPQRDMLEQKLMAAFKAYDGPVLFVKGIVEEEQISSTTGNMTIYNYLMGSELEIAINESALIVSRSGYTTVMDLAKLGKKAFFIPTPGQFEQEYLAKRLTEKGLAASCSQDAFTIEKLKNLDDYKGLETFDYEVNYKKLFHLFKGK